MDTNELIEEFLTEHVNRITNGASDSRWQFYINPFTGKRVWYNHEDILDKFRCPDPEQETKGLSKLTSIP